MPRWTIPKMGVPSCLPPVDPEGAKRQRDHHRIARWSWHEVAMIPGYCRQRLPATFITDNRVFYYRY